MATPIKRSSWAIVVLLALLAASAWWQRAPSTAPPAADDVALAATSGLPAFLPPEAQETLRLIARGGPFPHRQDGSVFGNREDRLPRRPSGYYREYTVPTPGARNRGMRRIVCGGAPKTPDACYYTADHYASFRRIVP